MKTLFLSILFTGALVSPQTLKLEVSKTTDLAALPDYNSYRIHKMRSYLEIKTPRKIFVLKIA